MFTIRRKYDLIQLFILWFLDNLGLPTASYLLVNVLCKRQFFENLSVWNLRAGLKPCHVEWSWTILVRKICYFLIKVMTSWPVSLTGRKEMSAPQQTCILEGPLQCHIVSSLSAPIQTCQWCPFIRWQLAALPFLVRPRNGVTSFMTLIILIGKWGPMSAFNYGNSRIQFRYNWIIKLDSDWHLPVDIEQ